MRAALRIRFVCKLLFCRGSTVASQVHCRAKIVLRKVLFVASVLRFATILFRERVPGHTVGHVPSGRLRDVLLDFTLREQPAQLGNLRVGVELFQWNKEVLHTWIGIRFPMFEAYHFDL